jgi:hypothetical protein
MLLGVLQRLIDPRHGVIVSPLFHERPDRILDSVTTLPTQAQCGAFVSRILYRWRISINVIRSAPLTSLFRHSLPPFLRLSCVRLAYHLL